MDAILQMIGIILVVMFCIGFFGGMMFDNPGFRDGKSKGDAQNQQQKEPKRNQAFQGPQVVCHSCSATFPEYKLTYRYDNNRENDWQDRPDEVHDKEERNGREKVCPVCYSDDVYYV